MVFCQRRSKELLSTRHEQALDQGYSLFQHRWQRCFWWHIAGKCYIFDEASHGANCVSQLSLHANASATKAAIVIGKSSMNFVPATELATDCPIALERTKGFF